MAFQRQLFAGYSMFLFISMATALVAVVELHVVGSGEVEVAHQYTDEMVDVERVRFQAERVVATARGYMMMRAPDYLERLKEAAIDLDAQLAALRRAELASESAGDLRTIGHDIHDYATAASSVADEDPHEVDRSFERMFRPQLTSLQQRLNALASRERAKFERLLARSQDRAERAGLVVAIASLSGMVTSILLAIAVWRRLVRSYEEQRRAIDEARHAAAARQEMLAIVSHDLRSPLATVEMASDLVVMRLAGTAVAADVARHATAIRHAADRMKHLVDQMLELGQLDAGAMRLAVESCEVASLLREATELFATRASQGSVSLRCEPPPGAVIARADKERAIQVLSNLIGNALKFTPAGGTVVARAQPAGDVVDLQVEDTGVGIPADQLGKLFDRYWQGPRKSGGVGLGLYICKKLVEAHGGRIWVDSRPGEGSCFHFTLPCVTGATARELHREPLVLAGR